MPNQFLSPEGDIENYFVTEYWLIDQYVGDTLWTWGHNYAGGLGTNDTTNRSTPVTTLAGGANWKQVASGQGFSAAIKTDGTLWTWGNNSNGKLGDNTVVNKPTPVQVFGSATNWKQVDCAFGAFAAAIKTDGTLWTWGNNASYGPLGDNTVVNKPTPVTTFAGGTNWKQVSCGAIHAAAIKTDGTLWCWGYNGSGGLGINNTITRSTPVTTFAGGTDWKQVSCGDYHTAAIKTDGTLWIWGENGTGQLGDNTTRARSTPVTTFAGGTNWKQVSGGKGSSGGGGFNGHTAAIKTDGTLWTWGFNSYSQLGANFVYSAVVSVTGTVNSGSNVFTTSNTTGVNIGNRIVSTSPSSPISGFLNAVTAITPNVSITFSGTNFFSTYTGTIGLASDYVPTPVTTFAGGTNWKQVAGGPFTTAAIKTDGTLWTWGRNSYGQLGINGITTRCTPVTTFAGGTNWKQVAGERFTIAVTSGTDPTYFIS
jgi:alpha-tubulin suppressor-like RCC1 family protein